VVIKKVTNHTSCILEEKMYTNYNIDQLAVMPDDKLQTLYMKARGELNKMRRLKRDSFDVEINLCYFQRELKIREDRFRFVDGQPRNNS
jgi:hypothetical protein